MEKQNETTEATIKLVDFGRAIKALKRGKRIQRKNWRAKNSFIFMQVPAEIPAEIIPKMTSLPESVKKEFERRFLDCNVKWDVDCLLMNSIRYRNQIAIVHQNNQIHGWSATSEDILAEDWVILD